MKNKRKTTKSVKIRSDNAVKKISERYKRSVKAGKEKASKDLDKLLDELSKYYGKKGNVLKHKVRSKKARSRYNELLKEISKFSSKAKRAAKTKEQQTKETADKFSSHFGMSGEHAKEAADIFVNYTMPIIPGFSTSEAVLALAEAGFDSSTINNILQYLNNEVNFRTPDEMKKFQTEDDVNMFISHISNLYELDKDVPMEDLIKLSEQMVVYDLNDYENVLKEYHKDSFSIWHDVYDSDLWDNIDPDDLDEDDY